MMNSAWLMLCVKDPSYEGNLGYHDSPAEYYHWDSTVPNSKEPAPWDKIILWDGDQLLGVSLISRLNLYIGKKDRFRCPSDSCPMEHGSSGIKTRVTKTPKWRCRDCGHEFDNPRVEKNITIINYMSLHDGGWVSMHGILNGDQLRRLCKSPKSQHSIREFCWDNFMNKIPVNYQSEIEKLHNAVSKSLNK